MAKMSIQLIMLILSASSKTTTRYISTSHVGRRRTENFLIFAVKIVKVRDLSL